MSISCFGIKAKNVEQECALRALLDPSIDLVVLEGVAGSGKTIMALAAALEQVIELHNYKGVIFTRAPVSVGDDLGFLPGTVDEKMLPWCGGLVDNLEALRISDVNAERYIKIMAMQHTRGRSISDRIIIIDEVQNIPLNQLKVLLTRASENCKVICLGDSSQVDNKKLRPDNNALHHITRSSIDSEFIKIVNLPEGVRSRLSKWAADTL
jgi:PhoH-like ATPase